MEPRDPRDILRLKRCPQCDYDLRTLPEEHRCPECGFHYDPSMFALYGWERRERFSVAGRLLIGTWWERFFAVLLLLFVLTAVGFEVHRIWKTGRPRVGFLLVVLIAIIVQAIRMMPHVRRTEGAPRGTVQLLFTPVGASMRRGPGDARLISWRKFRKLRFQKLRFHRVGTDSWQLRLSFPLLSFRLVSPLPPVEIILECTPREAALIRGELRRRLQTAKSTSVSRPAN